MKLSEALILRKDIQSRLDEMENRLCACALTQEGESPAEEPAAEPETPAQEPEEPTPEETAKPAEATEQAVLEQEEQPAEEPQREAAAETDPREEPEEETDFPALGEDIFAEFEKKKQQILNIDIGQTPDERRSKFAGLKFGNDFNLMDDDDDF